MRRMYSQNELDSRTKEYLETNDIKVKTIEQSEANFVVSDDGFSSPTVPTGITVEKGYCKCEVFNRILYIVMTFKFTNTTEASISVANLISGFINLNDDGSISSKIFDVSGKSLEDNTGSNIQSGILGFRYSQDGGNPTAGFYTGGNASLYRYQNQKRIINYQFREFGSIQAGKTHILSARIWLSL